MMNTRSRWSRVLLVAGLVCMIVGAIDPLEGSLVILPGGVLAAVGAFLGKSAHRKLLYASLILMAVGIGAMWILSGVGGIGGTAGRSMWWGLLMLPYPVGLIMGLIGAIRSLAKAFARPKVD